VDGLLGLSRSSKPVVWWIANHNNDFGGQLKIQTPLPTI
jgi:hypothetical protein